MGKTDLHRQISDFRALVTGQFAISYTAFFISRFGIIFAIETEQILGHPLAYGLFFALLGELIRFLTLFLADKTYLSKRLLKPVSLAVVLSTWFISSFMGSLIAGIVLEIITKSQGHLLIRVIPSTFFSFAGFALASVIVAQITTQRRLLRKSVELNIGALKEEHQSLDSLLSQQELREKTAREEITKGLSGLRAQIESISEKTEDREIGKLVEAIEDYGSKVVRNYSHSLRVDSKNRIASESIEASIKPTLVYFFQLKNLNFSPIFCSLIIFTINLPLQVARNGVSGIYFSVLLIAVLGPLVTVFFLLIRQYVAERFLDRILAVGSALLLLYVAIDFLARNLLDVLDQSLPFPPQISAFRSILAVLVISTAVTLQLRSENLKTLLEKSLSESIMTAAKFSAENIRLKKELAQLLHGPVQGKLASIAMSLNLYLTQDSAKKTSEREKWIAKARETLYEIVDDIEGTSNFPEGNLDISIYLTDLSAQYAFLLDIEAKIEPDTKEVLEENAELTDAVQDIVANAVTNSLRHGFSRKVEILLDSPSPHHVRVTVKDDGVGPKVGLTPGFGLNHVISLGGTWTLTENAKGGALLTVIVSTTL